MPPSPALSIQTNMFETLAGRQVGVLVDDGSDADTLAKLRKLVDKAGGKCVIVAPKIGGAVLSNGERVKADGQLAGSPSQLFDAVAIVLSSKAVTKLMNEGAAVQFVMDAFGHLKAIGSNADVKPLLDKAGVSPDEGVTDLSAKFVAAAQKRFWMREPNVRILP